MRRVRVGVLGAILLLMAIPVPALAQGPGVDNPGPNVGNFGTCLIVTALMAEAVNPDEFATSQEPGVFIERGEDDFLEPKPGFACSVGFQGPPP